MSSKTITMEDLVRISTFILVLVLALSSFEGAANSQETGKVISTPDDRTGLGITIYNENLALVRDARKIELKKGESLLEFQGVSGRIRPETALLAAGKVSLLEQNFDFDLLDPNKLLEKAVGQQVRIYRPHPTEPRDTVEVATVLAANNGVVLQFSDRIEASRSGVPGRIVFDRIPDNLRAKPTLSMLLDAPKKFEKTAELTYMTGGLGWKADYVASLNANETRIDLQGWVTLTNQSGTSFENATLQLVAGDVNQVAPDAGRLEEIVVTGSRVRREALMAAGPKQEALLDFHLYTLPRNTSVLNNQTKQVGFVKASNVKVRKIYRAPSFGFGTFEYEPAIVLLDLQNSKEAGLGLPLPKGVVRIYKADSVGRAQFVGEDRINHLPENEHKELKLGEAFDVTYSGKLISQDRNRRMFGRKADTYVMEITFKNAKDETAEVEFTQNLWIDASIEEESAAHELKDGNTALWRVSVPSKGETKLTYTVRNLYD